MNPQKRIDPSSDDQRLTIVTHVGTCARADLRDVADAEVVREQRVLHHAGGADHQRGEGVREAARPRSPSGDRLRAGGIAEQAPVVATDERARAAERTGRGSGRGVRFVIGHSWITVTC